jgi:hypothetical protein
MRTEDFFKSVNFCYRSLQQKERNLSFKESSFREFLAVSSKARFLLRELEQNLKSFFQTDELLKPNGEAQSVKM